MAMSSTAKGKTTSDPLSEVEDSAVDDMISSLGLDPESVDVEGFKSALGDYVEACMKRHMGGGMKRKPSMEEETAEEEY